MWLNENGRAMNHILWQIAVGSGERFYDLLISACFALCVIWVHKVAFPDQHRDVALWPWIIIVLVFLYFVPDSESLFFWAAGGCHYLFPAMMTMGFFLLLRRGERGLSRPWMLGLSTLFAFCAGWTHEIFALPVSLALFISVCRQGKIIPRRIWLLIIAYWLGAMLIILSPGTWHRILTTQGGEINLLSKLLTSFKIFRYGRVFYALMFMMLGMAVCFRSSLTAFIRREAFLHWCLLGALGIVVILGVGGRAVWSVEVFSLLILLRWMKSLPVFSSCRMQVVAMTLGIGICVHQACLVIPFREAWDTYRAMEEACHQTSGDFQCVPMDDWHSANPLIDPFVAHPYWMMMQDYWMRAPLSVQVCRTDEYQKLMLMDNSDFAAGHALQVGGEFYYPYDEMVLREVAAGHWEYTLSPIRGTSSGGWLYLSWHMLIQKILPDRYPTKLVVAQDQITRLDIGERTYIRIERPIAPVEREILACKYVD